MRVGWLASPIIHVLVLAALIVAWPQMSAKFAAIETHTVPIDVLTFSDQSNISAIASDADLGPKDKPEDEGTPQPYAPDENADVIPDSSKPPPKKETHQSPNLNDINNLIDRAQKKNGTADKRTRITDAIGAKPREGVGLANDLSANELDYVSTKLQGCWSGLRDKAEPERLTVIVHVELRKNGALRLDPALVSPTTIPSGDIALRAAARTALNAVRLCAPFSELKPERYAHWREFDVTFGTKVSVK